MTPEPDPMPEEYEALFRRDFPEEMDEPPGTVRWFGQPWPSPRFPALVCRPDTHVRLPEGELCAYCDEPLVAPHDRGVAIPNATDGRYYFYGLGCWVGALGLPPMYSQRGHHA